MGIAGLLPLLKAAAVRTHVSEYRGQRVAVDAYGWLHRGAYGCAAELAQGLPTDGCVLCVCVCVCACERPP
jgi:exonuclease 1